MGNEKHLGDNPCQDCKSEKNIVWFTDNVLWNIIMGKDRMKIYCIFCFTARAEMKYKITGWRLLPEFKITNKDK